MRTVLGRVASGTGNAGETAHAVVQEAGAAGIEVPIASIVVTAAFAAAAAAAAAAADAAAAAAAAADHTAAAAGAHTVDQWFELLLLVKQTAVCASSGKRLADVDLARTANCCT